MKKEKTIILFLEQLRKIPIIQIACEKVGVSRNSIYRWRKEDKQFREEWDKAITEGQLLVNDMSESQLISAIKDRNMQAIMYWLRHHHPSYTNTLQIKHALEDEDLTPEQEALVREALRLAFASQIKIETINQNNNEQQLPKSDSAGTSGSNDKGQESQGGDN